VAAQDQAISTKLFKNNIVKEEIESKCRLCKHHEKSTDRLTSGCLILAKKEYLMRHDEVCTHLRYPICKALGNETTDKWYTHMPKPVYEEGDVTVLWNQAVNTDREVTANRPDIIIKNKKEKTCILLDVAMPVDKHVVQKQAEMKLKYKSLCIEMQRMWNLKCTIIPVITGATGIVTRSLRKNLEAIPGRHSIASLQKTDIFGASHIILKVLQCEA
jgi:hypothetical protein